VDDFFIITSEDAPPPRRATRWGRHGRTSGAHAEPGQSDFNVVP